MIGPQVTGFYEWEEREITVARKVLLGDSNSYHVVAPQCTAGLNYRRAFCFLCSPAMHCGAA